MHPCLNVDEIVRLIACELVTSGRKATAVCLACCSRSLQEPVLDVLWATQAELSPLFKCFPGDVWNEGGYTSFKRLPTATEWVRFQKYARRMRELKDRGTPKTLSSEVYSVIQLYTINEPLLPNLTTLDLRGIEESFLPFLPLFLSPSIASISFESFANRVPRSMIASAITNLPTPCPNLQDITLRFLPADPMITTAVSRMFFATNQNVLRKFHVDSPLTDEASEAIYKSQNLRNLSVVIGKGTSIPSASLPNLTYLKIVCEDGSDGLQLFRGATFGKLESVYFHLESRPIDDFLQAFNRAALSSFIQNTLSWIHFTSVRPWNPNYSSLLPFTRLVDLEIESPCDGSCSRVDDNIVIDLSQAMPKLQSLCLGDWPCPTFTGGVTAKGLVALAHNCPNLSSLCVHFQVASLTDPPIDLETTRDAGHSASWTGCALTVLEVGEMSIPVESAPMIALTLLRIFPRIEGINFMGSEWGEVASLIRRSKQIVDCSRARLAASN